MRWKRAISAGFFIGGLCLLIVLLVETDLQRIVARVRGGGAFFVFAFAAYVGTLSASAAAWRSLLEDGGRVSAPRIFAAAWCGESVNFVLPGGAPGEIAKGVLLRDRVAPGELAISLTIYNWLSGLVIFLTAVLSSAYALAFSGLDPGVAIATLVAASLLALTTGGLRFLLRRRRLQGVLGALQRVPLLDFDLERARARVDQLDERIQRLWRGDRPRFVRALGLMLVARVCTIAEVYLLLAGLMPEVGPAFLCELSLLVQAATQVVLYASMFVPGQLGALEGGTAGIFVLLGLGGWLGLALELSRRARKLLAIVLAAALWLFLRRSRGGGTALTSDRPNRSAREVL